MIPNAFIIGAQKSGTSFLAALLGQHPDICVSRPKEPHFFSKYFDQGWEYYTGCFTEPNSKIILDASTTYTFLKPQRNLMDPRAPGLTAPVPKRIFDVNPDAKFIYLLRDPVERIKSAYLHKMRVDGVKNKRISLLECIENDPMLELVSKYSDQVERYLEYFDISQFRFFLFDDVIRNTEATLKHVCDFLEIDMIEFSLKKADKHKNASAQKTEIMKAIDFVTNQYPYLKDIVKRNFSYETIDILRNTIGRKPVLANFYDEEAVSDLFQAEKARIEEFSGIQL